MEWQEGPLPAYAVPGMGWTVHGIDFVERMYQ